MLPGMGAVGKINSMCLVYNFITYPITKNSKKKQQQFRGGKLIEEALSNI